MNIPHREVARREVVKFRFHLVSLFGFPKRILDTF